jgi:hypothetical protein
LEDEKGNFIPDENIDLRIVRIMKKRKIWNSSPDETKLIPDILDYYSPIDIKANITKQYWLTIKVPEDAEAGTYTTLITIKPGNSTEKKIKLKLKVLPIELLDDPNKVHGIYYDTLGHLSVRYSNFYKYTLQELKDLKEHGIKGIVAHPWALPKKTSNGGVEIYYKEFKDVMRSMQEVGFNQPVPYFGVPIQIYNKLLQLGFSEKEADKKYKDIIIELQKMTEENNWPELLFYPEDEPYGWDPFNPNPVRLKRMDNFFKLAKLIKEINNTKVFLTIPSWANLNFYDEETGGTVDDLVDVRNYDGGSIERMLKKDKNWFHTLKNGLINSGDEVWMYYNQFANFDPEIHRLTNGFYFWNSPFKAHYPWIYQRFHGDPFNDLDGKYGDIAYAYPDPNRDYAPTLPTLKWEAFREGVDDIRYLYTLQVAIEENENNPEKRNEIQRAKELINQLKDELNTYGPDVDRLLEHFKYNDYQNWRWRIAQAIIELNKQKEKPQNKHAPIAKANAEPIQGKSPLRVYFSSQGSYDPDKDKLAYTWDFGDGSFTNIDETFHTYTKPGNYIAILTVSDGGNETTDYVNIKVEDKKASKSNPIDEKNPTERKDKENKIRKDVNEAIIYGKVTDRKTDKPIPNAWIYAKLPVKNKSGKYLIQAVKVGYYDEEIWKKLKIGKNRIDFKLNPGGNIFSFQSLASNGDYYTIAEAKTDRKGKYELRVRLKSSTLPLPNDSPQAFIDSISPNPAKKWEVVNFKGHGEDKDGKIIAYKWISSIDGELSNKGSFTTNNLSVGTHTIYLKVEDNNGKWSERAMASLVIQSPSQDNKSNLIYAGPTSPPAPKWTKDLILYQMRVDQFTPEGTFNAARRKLLYLYDLGITGIVLNPVAEFFSYEAPKTNINKKHIYYCVKEPDKLEPLLGSEQDFKRFVEEAHNYGIKVFLDVVTFGVHPPVLYNFIPLAGSWNSDNLDKVGFYNPLHSFYILLNKNKDNSDVKFFQYGPKNSGWKPLIGDWDGDGKDTIGLYNPSTGKFHLKNTNSGGGANIVFTYKPSFSKNIIPISGDWDGDGKDTVGLYEQDTSTFYLLMENKENATEISFQYGPHNAGWIPITGDWNNNGKDTVGLYDPSTSVFYLNYGFHSGEADLTFQFGPSNSGWLPISGDWDGDGKDTIGLYDPREKVVYLRNSNSGGSSDIKFAFSLDRLESSYTKNHPDWFQKDRNGHIKQHPVFGFNMWDWSNPNFKNWWVNMIVNDWILKYDLDGLRLDCEPGVTNYKGAWLAVREKAASKGKNIVIFSELRSPNDNRHNEYHFSQENFAVNPLSQLHTAADFMNRDNIVDIIKSDKFDERFYTNALSSHDRGANNTPHYGAQGRPVYFGYGMLFATVIPFWYMGEEFNNSCTLQKHYGRLYFNPMHWEDKDKNIKFLNKVKKMIQIRKQYKDIIAPFPPSLNQTNIVKVPSIGTDLQAYALYRNKTSIIVVGKKDVESGPVVLNIPLKAMNMEGDSSYLVTDLMLNTSNVFSESQLLSFKMDVDKGDVRIFKIEKYPGNQMQF